MSDFNNDHRLYQYKATGMFSRPLVSNIVEEGCQSHISNVSFVGLHDINYWKRINPYRTVPYLFSPRIFTFVRIGEALGMENNLGKRNLGF